MQRRKKCSTVPHGSAAGALLLLLTGCASPGPPRPPSLRLPAPLRGLTASRQGDLVALQFTMPTRTTDGQAIRETSLTPVICRAEAGSSCIAEPPHAPVASKGPHDAPNVVTLRDALPAAFASGGLRPLAYRVELLNDHMRTAGFSAPVWVAAGSAPEPVAGFHVEATRLGTLLAWAPGEARQGTVLVRRTRLGASPDAPAETSLLRAESVRDGATDTPRMLDSSAVEGVAYRYAAYRERTETIDGHTLTIRSADSPAVQFTLVDTFPPPTPAELNAASFTTEATAKQPAMFAVDLIWKPVDDPGLVGYNVYRAPAGGERVKLSAALVTAPAFHDAMAKPDTIYVYSVTAVDRKGNESAAATVRVAP